MSAITADMAMIRYKHAYYAFYGKYPSLRSNNGWIKINGGYTSYRPSQLEKMTTRLGRIINQREERKKEEEVFDSNDIIFDRNDVWCVELPKEKKNQKKQKELNIKILQLNAENQRLRLELETYKVHKENNVKEIKNLNSVIISLRREMQKLKRNSIVFSMNDEYI